MEQGGVGAESRATSALEEAIVFGRYAPGARLIEVDLITFLDARRHVVRSAISHLETRGLVVRRPNRGAVVRDLTRREVEDLYFMRVLVHQTAAREMPLPISAEQHSRLCALQRDHDRAIAARDRAAGFRANDAFHRAIHALQPNALLVEALESYARRSNLVRSIAFRHTARLVASAEEHRAMIDALATGDRDRFADLDIKHVLGAKTAFLAAHAL